MRAALPHNLKNSYGTLSIYIYVLLLLLLPTLIFQIFDIECYMHVNTYIVLISMKMHRNYRQLFDNLIRIYQI